MVSRLPSAPEATRLPEMAENPCRVFCRWCEASMTESVSPFLMLVARKAVIARRLCMFGLTRSRVFLDNQKSISLQHKIFPPTSYRQVFFTWFLIV